MKGAVTTGLLALWGTILSAQDAAPPNVDQDSREETAVVRPTPLPSPDIPDVHQLDAVFKETSLGKQADERRLHVEWRQLANQAANDPDVIAAKSAVMRARTDLEKRQLLRDYYALYYGRMHALAGTNELKTALDAVKAAHISMTSQPHVRPSTDRPSPTPIPTASGDRPSLTPTPTPPPNREHKHKKKHRWGQ